MKIGQLCCRLCNDSAQTMLTTAQLCFTCMTSRTDDGSILMACHMVESCVGIRCRAGLQKCNVVCCDIHYAAVFHSASLLAEIFCIKQLSLTIRQDLQG